MKHFFFGGIHPRDQKQMASASMDPAPVRVSRVAIPMVQHMGEACTPLVEVGERVLVGQKIGDGQGLCVPVHASISGYVRALELRPHPSGKQIMSVVIENDYLDEAIPYSPNTQPLDSLKEETLLKVIREAGIVGMGGAAFPSDRKAMAAMGNVHTLIANGCECEPYITADDFLLRHHPEQVLEGMTILGKLLSATHFVLAVEDNKVEAIRIVGDFLTHFPKIRLQILPARYPQGAEKQLVQAVTGQEVPPGQLPAAVGCAVYNVSTCAAVFCALRLGRPLTHRITTVSGEALSNPRNFRVPIGASFADVIRQAGPLRGNSCRVIAGGPMMGIPQGDLRVSVVKATNAILCLPSDTVSPGAVCLRCGKCVEVCPMRLLPLYLYHYTESENIPALRRFHLTDCISCGCCAYVCPGRLELVAAFRRGRQLLRDAEKREGTLWS